MIVRDPVPSSSGSDAPALWSLSLPSRAAPASSPPRDRGSRLHVRIRRRALDREIAAGFQANADPARALRAQQLLSERERSCVATCLANILEAADERHADPSSPLRLNHAEVLAARHAILALIEALRSERIVSARGVALARLLTEDGDSPLVRARSELTVRQAVSEAIAAL